MSFLKNLVESCGALWGEGSVSIALADRYENVANSLEGDAGFPIDIAELAYARNDIEMKAILMRGGYDGAVLSQKGLPCSNIFTGFTGAHNFHSIYEYLPVKSLKAASDVVVEVIKITVEQG